MKIFTSIADYQAWRGDITDRVVFVPTMGALHQGHGSLITLARRLAGGTGKVVASIFVNPTQFAAGEDFGKYPRTLDTDRAMLESLSADVLFLPDEKQMYPHSGDLPRVIPGRIATLYEGADRPGHFEGVCTVVAKLLNIIQPAVLILGQKDFQQQAIVAAMLSSLNFPVTLMVAPTIRQADGLAMSSRNRYLSPEQREKAPALYRALRWAADEIKQGRCDATALNQTMRTTIESAGMVCRYALICDRHTLAPVTGRAHRDNVILGAAILGATRLLDNVLVDESNQAAA